MTDRLLDKFRLSSADDKQGSLGPCVVLAEKPPFALEFRKQDGTRIALPLGLLQSATFDPSGNILLRFSGFDVAVWGPNLGRAFDALVSLRAAALAEWSDGNRHGDQTVPRVLGIQVTQTG